MILTLLIPDLIWPEPADESTLANLPCPRLEQLLARGSLTRTPREPLELLLARLLGTGSATLAACRLEHEENSPSLNNQPAAWVCIDPVNLQFHHERIILGDASRLNIQAEEAQTLISALNQTFPDLGTFHAPHPERWYLAPAPGLELPELPPPSAATGRQLGSLLPEAPQFSRLMNEVQMLLHTHPVNRARESQRQPLINGLWFWGGQPVQASNPTPITRVCSTHSLARGLATSSGLQQQGAPAGLAELLPGEGAQHTLVVLDELLPHALIEDGDAWRQTLEQLEQQWFEPLLKGAGKHPAQLRLLSPCAFGLLEWRLDAASRWKFWRRPKPLASLAQELARPQI